MPAIATRLEHFLAIDALIQLAFRLINKVRHREGVPTLLSDQQDYESTEHAATARHDWIDLPEVLANDGGRVV